MSSTVASPRFCSAVATSLGADLLGTAPMYDEFLMIEFDLPWEREVMETPGFPQAVADAVAAALAQGRRLRVQAFAPDSRYSAPGMRRIMYFRNLAANDDVARVADFDSVEYVVSAADVPALTRFLLFDKGNGQQLASQQQDRRANGAGVRDMFVCTHGARDACCGKFGAALQVELDQLVADNVATDGGVRRSAANTTVPVRVWRVSHLGGHRFAPTLLDLPSGRYWGALDSAALPHLLQSSLGGKSSAGSAHQALDPEALRRYHRGWAGLYLAPEQVAEGEAWRRVGPEWMHYEKWIWTVSEDTDTREQVTTVAIEWMDPASGNEGRIEIDVAVSHTIALPESCGGPNIQSKQWMAVRYEEA